MNEQVTGNSDDDRQDAADEVFEIEIREDANDSRMDVIDNIGLDSLGVSSSRHKESASKRTRLERNKSGGLIDNREKDDAMLKNTRLDSRLEDARVGRNTIRRTSAMEKKSRKLVVENKIAELESMIQDYSYKTKNKATEEEIYSLTKDILKSISEQENTSYSKQTNKLVPTYIAPPIRANDDIIRILLTAGHVIPDGMSVLTKDNPAVMMKLFSLRISKKGSDDLPTMLYFKYKFSEEKTDSFIIYGVTEGAVKYRNKLSNEEFTGTEDLADAEEVIPVKKTINAPKRKIMQHSPIEEYIVWREDEPSKSVNKNEREKRNRIEGPSPEYIEKIRSAAPESWREKLHALESKLEEAQSKPLSKEEKFDIGILCKQPKYPCYETVNLDKSHEMVGVHMIRASGNDTSVHSCYLLLRTFGFDIYVFHYEPYCKGKFLKFDLEKISGLKLVGFTIGGN